MEDESAPSSAHGVADQTKPEELTRLAAVSAELFSRLKTWFAVPDSIRVPLARIDGDRVARDLQDVQKVAAFAMRKLQALHLTAQPGVPTKPDVPVSLIDSVLRALVEAPNRRLTFELTKTDWDHESELLEAGLIWKRPPPESELARFQHLVRELCRSRAALATLLDAGNHLLV